MSIWTKIAIGTGIGVGVAAAVNYISGLKRADAQLEIVPEVMVHKLDLKGLAVRIDVTMKNPTQGTFAIQYPFIKLLYQNQTIGSSQAIDKTIQLPPFGEARIENIMIQMPITNILITGYNIITDLLAGKTVAMQVKTITTIKLGWKKLPYEKTDEIQLKKGKDASPVKTQGK